MKDKQYSLYLASGIKLWQEYFHSKYSRCFNKKLHLFEPATIGVPADHRKIPIKVATYDLDKVNKCDALLVYMKHYTPPDGSPAGTDSTWECGYAIAHGKPTIMLIEDKAHIDYYAAQWMVSFSINAVLTASREVAALVKNHPKFVHTKILLANNPEQFEIKIIEYLADYYRSIYSRTGIINYYVDEQARKMFAREKLEKLIFNREKGDPGISKLLRKIAKANFEDEKDYLLICEIEREISQVIRSRPAERSIDAAMTAVLSEWRQPAKKVLDCLEHSIKPPFAEVPGRKQGIKKTRPELFYELYDLVTHHLVCEKRWIKSSTFPCDVGAVLELYNWMNTYALDDVFDSSRSRQGHQTVWAQYSRRDAIFTGMVGHLLALKLLYTLTRENASLGSQAAGILNDYNELMYRGQVFDLSLTLNTKKKKQALARKKIGAATDLYCQRIYGICGGFYEAIGQLAAVLGNKEEQIANAKEIDRVSPLIGRYYGLIQMLRNDLGDYIMIEDLPALSKGMKDVSHSDIAEGKVALAYLAAIYSGYLTGKEKQFLWQKLGAKLSRKDKLKINELLWRSGAIDLSVELIMSLIEYVKKELLPCYHETPTRMKWMFSLMEITKEIRLPFQKQARKFKWYKYEFDPVLRDELVHKLTDEFKLIRK